ncbi:hypothetical protein [Streptomyces sp. NBC_01481]|uniref:hypothetical protein n=1 Tax=Streptomyces sp. NBC_01481 TaxID=2975869 RepID=UPI002B1CBB1C|nr:hypothetical protein [Streptomyces sp. NBC_01481]
MDASKAVATGMRCRPIEKTVADAWAWMRADGHRVEHPRWAEHGIAPEKEAAILAALGHR